MQQFQGDFLAHASINQRIYEFCLSHQGEEQENLTINNISFPEFTQIPIDPILNKRSILIEDHLVHFYQINNVLTVEVEEPDENRTGVEEKLIAPTFPFISKITDNEEYYTGKEYKKKEQKVNLTLFFYGIIIMFAFLHNPPLGIYTGMLIAFILDFLNHVFVNYKLAKQFSKGKDQ